VAARLEWTLLKVDNTCGGVRWARKFKRSILSGSGGDSAILDDRTPAGSTSAVVPRVWRNGR
jgi:hypothetical protein